MEKRIFYCYEANVGGLLGQPLQIQIQGTLACVGSDVLILKW